MSAAEFPIPGRLNLLLSAGTIVLLIAVIRQAGRVETAWGIAGLSLAYGVLMNTGYALIHEAEHGSLHPQRRVNIWLGVILALFFPAPFHLIRQGHLGHHLR